MEVKFNLNTPFSIYKKNGKESNAVYLELCKAYDIIGFTKSEDIYDLNKLKNSFIEKRHIQLLSLSDEAEIAYPHTYNPLIHDILKMKPNILNASDYKWYKEEYRKQKFIKDWFELNNIQATRKEQLFWYKENIEYNVRKELLADIKPKKKDSKFKLFEDIKDDDDLSPTYDEIQRVKEFDKEFFSPERVKARAEALENKLDDAVIQKLSARGLERIYYWHAHQYVFCLSFILTMITAFVFVYACYRGLRYNDWTIVGKYYAFLDRMVYKSFVYHVETIITILQILWRQAKVFDPKPHYRRLKRITKTAIKLLREIKNQDQLISIDKKIFFTKKGFKTKLYSIIVILLFIFFIFNTFYWDNMFEFYSRANYWFYNPDKVRLRYMYNTQLDDSNLSEFLLEWDYDQRFFYFLGNKISLLYIFLKDYKFLIFILPILIYFTYSTYINIFKFEKINFFFNKIENNYISIKKYFYNVYKFFV